MRKTCIAISGILLSFTTLANNWGLCPGPPVTGYIPCDTVCFGPAGLRLGKTYVEVEVGLQEAILSNTNSWVSMNETFLDFLSTYNEVATESNANRASAYDGMVKIINGSFELMRQTNEKNTDSFINSYKTLRQDHQIMDMVMNNARDYGAQEGAPTGNHLLVNIDDYARAIAEQKVLDGINESHKDKSFYLNSSEKNSYFTQKFSSAAGEITVNDFASLLIKDSITSQEWELLQRALTVLYLDNNNKEAPTDKIANAKVQFALDSLVKTMQYRSEADTDVFLIETDIENIIFDAYISGENTRSLTHGLKQEHNFQIAAQNSLLNNYLKQKKASNALKIFTGL